MKETTGTPHLRHVRSVSPFLRFASSQHGEQNNKCAHGTASTRLSPTKQTSHAFCEDGGGVTVAVRGTTSSLSSSSHCSMPPSSTVSKLCTWAGIKLCEVMKFKKLSTSSIPRVNFSAACRILPSLICKKENP